MKLKEVTVAIGLMVFTLINVSSNRAVLNKKDTSLDSLTEYLVDAEKGGNKTVVIVVSGTTYINGEPVLFVDAEPLKIAKKELKKAGYSIITLTTPCAIRCLNEYTKLGVLIVELNADAVIYKGIHSDFGTDSFNKILTTANIPIYSFGSEVILDYTLYTGPDNLGMAKAIANGLKNKIQGNETVVYIDTISKLNTNILDNGYQRIKAVKEELTALGLKEVETVTTLWSRARTFEEISRVLTKHGKVNYIIAPSIETGLGAAEAVEKLGLQDEVKIIAMDFTEEGVRLLKEGKFYGLVGQGLTNQGLTIADSILMGLNSKGIKKLYSTDTVITMKNLDDYEITIGNYKW